MTTSDSGRRVAFECPRCARTLVVIYHTGAPRPESRSCPCGAMMGIVLVGDRVKIVVDRLSKNEA